MKHPTEEQLILHHFGESPEGQAVSEHLASCAQCRGEFEALRRTLGLAETVTVPARNEDYGGDVWRRLQPRLRNEGAGGRLAGRRNDWWSTLGRRIFGQWKLAAGLAAAVCVAFLAGRAWERPTRTTPTPSILAARPGNAPGRERVLLAEIGDHLERSQVALIELINSQTNGVVDLSLERSIARQLVDVNRLYRQTAQAQGEVGMASVLEDLERTLIEISNSPEKLSPAEFAEFRRRVDTEGMLFEVQVVGARLRTREAGMQRGATGRSIQL